MNKLLPFTLILILSIFGANFSNSSLEGRDNQLELLLEHVYKFERGYNHTIIEYEDGILYSISPKLQRIYLIDTQTKSIDYFTYERGRGPNEFVRAPFGISISEKGIFSCDGDLQRLVHMNHNGLDRSTKLLPFNNNPLASIFNIEDQQDALGRVLNPMSGYRYMLFVPYNLQVIAMYEIPDEIDNIFRVDGRHTISGDYLLHMNYYYGDIIIWDKTDGDHVKTIQVLDPGNPKPMSAQMGNIQGSIPPQDTKEKFINITNNPTDANRVFLVIESENGKYRTDRVYDYDFIEEKIVGEYKLDGPVKLLQSSKTHLFVYSEASDAIYQYEIKKNQ